MKKIASLAVAVTTLVLLAASASADNPRGSDRREKPACFQDCHWEQGGCIRYSDDEPPFRTCLEYSQRQVCHTVCP